MRINFPAAVLTDDFAAVGRNIVGASAKDAAGIILAHCNPLAVGKQFDRAALIQSIGFPQGRWNDDSSQIIDVA